MRVTPEGLELAAPIRFDLYASTIAPESLHAIDAVARERNASRGVVVLAWLLRHPSNIVPIVGSADPNNIKDLAKAAELKLSREEWYSLLEGALGERLP